MTKPILSSRSFVAFSIVFLFFFLSSCSDNKTSTTEEIIEIDVLQAFDTQKNINASDFIDEVDIIPLESSKESYFPGSSCYFVGQKYILALYNAGAQIFLFNRDGSFVRKIGNKGKGPGEFGDPREATMDPNEEFVYLYDASYNKLFKYSVNGEFIKDYDVSDISPSRYATSIKFINKDQFVLVNRRPYKPMDGFASLSVFDKDLNLIKSILPRPNDDNLRINVEPHATFTVSPTRMTFWEPYADTLYTISSEGEAIPTHVVGFSKGGPDKDFITTNINPNLYADNSIVTIIDAGDYLHIWGMKDNEWFSAIYNQKSNEIFEVSRENNCYLSKDNKPYGFNNDLYGVGYIWLRNYSPNIDRFIYLLDLSSIADYYDLECLAQKQVKYPKLRDQLIEYANDPEGSPQLVMVIMKVK